MWNLNSEECRDRADSLRDSGLSLSMNDEMKLTKHTTLAIGSKITPHPGTMIWPLERARGQKEMTGWGR